MIARFRPVYSYSDILAGFFSSQKDIEILRKKIQELFKTEYVFFYSQARVALYILIKALSQKGAVISPAYNCIVVPDAIRFAGMDNQLADVSLDDYNMTIKDVQKVINNQSKILLATHQYGIPCDIEGLSSVAKRNELILIEDAAAAMGANINGKLVGTSGVASIMSFQDTKVLNGVTGGCLVIFDKSLAARVKELSFNVDLISKLNFLKKAVAFKTATLPLVYSLVFPIWTKKAGAYTMPEESEKNMPDDYLEGINVVTASLINKQIPNLEEIVQKKKNIGDKYLKLLSGVKSLILPKIKRGITPAWERFPIRVEDRLNFFRNLSGNGIDLAWTFSYSCAKEYSQNNAPNTLHASEHVLNLPIYPDLDNNDIIKIVEKIKYAN